MSVVLSMSITVHSVYTLVKTECMNKVLQACHNVVAPRMLRPAQQYVRTRNTGMNHSLRSHDSNRSFAGLLRLL